MTLLRTARLPASRARGLPGRTPLLAADPPSAVVVSDTFNRADQTPPGNADSGQTYSAFFGTGLSIITNQLGKTLASSQGSVVDAGVADGVLTAEVTATGGGGLASVVLRAVDTLNYLRLRDNGQLLDVVAGVGTLRGTMSSADILGTLEVTLDGATVEVRLNGVLELTATVVSLLGTRFGFWTSDTILRVDSLTFST